MLILRDNDIAPLLKSLTREQCHSLLLSLWRALAAYSRDHAAGNTSTNEGDMEREKDSPNEGDKEREKDSPNEGDKEREKDRPKAAVIHQPRRQVVTTSTGNTTLFMPASDTHAATGIKIVTLPGSGGAPRGAVNVFAPAGELLGVLNAEEITAFRTAGVSMLPLVFHHGVPDRAHVVVFGAGKQAEWHVRLLLLLAGEKVRRITVVNRGRAGAQRLRDEVGPDASRAFPHVETVYRSREDPDFSDDQTLRDVVAGADAILCCTPSTRPLFPGRYLQESERTRFISLIGSYKPHMQEVDATTLLSGGRILVDSKAACLAEAGELIMAGVTEEQLLEIGELHVPASLDSPRQEKPALQNTVFKCVGMGIMDVVVARELLQIASQRGLGVAIDDF
ncbi:hypothetical protein VTO42DRAFT_4244 [Malbranchea cinnamomea]